MRLIDHPEMAVAVEKMVRRLNLSGLLGFDFMVDAGNGDAFLIEINPRITQVGHIALGTGRDLPAALFAAMSGVSVPSAVKVTDNDSSLCSRRNGCEIRAALSFSRDITMFRGMSRNWFGPACSTRKSMAFPRLNRIGNRPFRRCALLANAQPKNGLRDNPSREFFGAPATFMARRKQMESAVLVDFSNPGQHGSRRASREFTSVR